MLTEFCSFELGLAKKSGLLRKYQNNYLLRKRDCVTLFQIVIWNSVKEVDKRVIWKNMNELQLLLKISQFIEKNSIKTCSQYQEKLSEFPKEVPSVWFIIQRYGSWNNLLRKIDRKENQHYQWNHLSDEELIDIACSFIEEEQICSQRKYEQKVVGKNVPSLSTLKKRMGDVRPLFKKHLEEALVVPTNFELLLELKKEIIRLELEQDLSMTTFKQKNQSPQLPSVDTIMRRTNKNWEELMSELGYNYREIKREKMKRNLKRR